MTLTRIRLRPWLTVLFLLLLWPLLFSIAPATAGRTTRVRLSTTGDHIAVAGEYRFRLTVSDGHAEDRSELAVSVAAAADGSDTAGSAGGSGGDGCFLGMVADTGLKR
ncbi:MAG: hypothetical protein QNJ22_20675 [Desulfosarcinaceae bacterium]|nr:hypothetical protein [Desulfosarcinaceae bacterium]